MAFTLNYDDAIGLDAEALAEGGIVEGYESLLPKLRQFVREAAANDKARPRRPLVRRNVTRKNVVRPPRVSWVIRRTNWRHKTMADSTPPAGSSQAPASLPKKGRCSLLWWGRLANYVMLGAAALVILLEIIDSGVWRRLGIPLLFISMAIVNLAVMHAREQRHAEPGAAPDPSRDSGFGGS